MKRIFAVILAVCLVFGLCACNNGGDSTEPTGEPVNTTQGTEPAATPGETEPADDGRVTYTVTVTDEGGNPIPGAMVQLCLEVCMPGVTDESGVATFSVAEEDYKVSFLSLPAGYEYTTEEQEFYFDDGSYDMTIALKAVA